MKVTIEENAVILKAENPHEEETLRRLQRRGVEKIEYKDGWESQGGLGLKHSLHPFDH